MSALAGNQFPRSGYITRSNSSGLADVLDVLLDKGLVIDVFLRVSLVGIELLTVDARIVIASVDTYLRFAEAVNRLELGDTSGAEGLPQLVEDMTQNGAESKTKGVLAGAKESLFGSGGSSEDNEDSDDNDESDEGSAGSSRRSGASSRSRSRSSSSSRGRS